MKLPNGEQTVTPEARAKVEWLRRARAGCSFCDGDGTWQHPEEKTKGECPMDDWHHVTAAKMSEAWNLAVAALGAYAKHKPDCEAWGEPGDQGPPDNEMCDCGFAALADGAPDKSDHLLNKAGREASDRAHRAEQALRRIYGITSGGMAGTAYSDVSAIALAALIAGAPK